MTTTSFHTCLKCDIPIIETLIYGANKLLYIKPVSTEKHLQFFIKKGFWCTTNDAYDCDKNDVEESPLDANIETNESQIIIENQSNLIKRLQYALEIAEDTNLQLMNKLYIKHQNKNIKKQENILHLQKQNIAKIEKEVNTYKKQLEKMKKPDIIEVSDDDEDEFESLFLSFL